MRIEIGNYVFNFTGESRSTRHGFAHDCWLSWYDVNKTNDYNTARATCQYLNRTWESYRFQSVFKKAVSNELAAHIAAARAAYKDAHGFARMTAAREDQFQNGLKLDATAAALRAALDALEHCGGDDVLLETVPIDDENATAAEKIDHEIQARAVAAATAYNLTGEEWALIENALKTYIDYLEEVDELFAEGDVPYIRETNIDDVNILLHKVASIGEQ